MKALKRLLRSRDFSFAFQRHPVGAISQVRYNDHPFYYRRGTVDSIIMERILFLGGRCEYILPAAVAPQFILDLGGNIGSSVVYFKRQWPGAEVLVVEPSEENFDLLVKNTDAYPDVQCLRAAVGAHSGRCHLDGGGRDYAGYRVTPGDDGSVEMFDYGSLPLRGRQVDLLKIDIEGAERGFLASIPDEVLAAIRWIVGEIHGVDDWKLFDHLSRTFEIDIRKTLHRPTAKFHACNKKYLNELIRGFKIKSLQY